jgi:hypothetical protein
MKRYNMMKGTRFKYLLLTLGTIVLGLLSRKTDACTIDFVKMYVGDVLWAAMVYFGCRFLFVRMGRSVSFGVALVFSYLIEISQLYHAPWINAIRGTTLGGLVLGFGFLWSDLVCYTVGVLLGVALDVLLVRKRK